MYLMYVDESGNTGTDYDNKSQPLFVLAGIIVEDINWHKINDIFEEEKIKIYPEFKENEIHASELFNAPKNSIFKKYTWEDNLKALEKIVDIITNLNLMLTFTCINKIQFKKHLNDTFGNNVKIDPYLYAFGLTYDSFSESLGTKHRGIILTDEINNISNNLELLYPKLTVNRKNIIEKSFYLDSKKNNFIQIADICALYINKYFCITNDYCRYNKIKENHCIQMYEKIAKMSEGLGVLNLNINQKNMLDNLFK